MQKKKIQNIEFYFKDNVVIMVYQTQYVAFHSYGKSNKRPLRLFASDLRASRKMNLNNVFRLARIHNVESMAVSSATIRSSL